MVTSLQGIVDLQTTTIAALQEDYLDIFARELCVWEDHPLSIVSSNRLESTSTDWKSCLLLKQPLVEYYTVLDGSVSGSVTLLGIGTSDISRTRPCGDCSNGWAIHGYVVSDHGFYHNGWTGITPEIRQTTGDVVTVRINRETNTISWEIERNGEDLGVVFEHIESEGIPDVVYPAVRVSGAVGNTITLLEIDGIVI